MGLSGPRSPPSVSLCRVWQVRVVQGKEPAHFRQVFKGQMVVHSGGVQSGFRGGQGEEAKADTPSE